MLLGSPLWAMATALTGIPRRLIQRGAYFWERVLPTAGVSGAYRFIAASFYALTGGAWGVAVVTLFGTRPT